MKNILLIILTIASSYSLMAQSLVLRDHNDVTVEVAHHEYRDNVIKLSETKLHVKNTTTSAITFGVKMYWISAVGSTGGIDDLQVCFGPGCFIVADSILGPQTVTDDTIPACSIYSELKIAPFAYTSKTGDGCTWRVTLFNVDNPADSVSSVFFWKNIKAGDVNEDGVIGVGEIAGDLDENGTIDIGEFAGDVDGDGVLSGVELYGDISGNDTIDGGEVAGDNNANGAISGDANADKMIGSGEIAGDIDDGGTIGTGEIAGDKFR